MISNKKIIIAAVAAYLIFAMAFVTTNYFFNVFETTYNGDKPVKVTEMNSNEVEVTQEEKEISEKALYPFKADEKIGYKNLNGKIIKDPSYDYGSYFLDGYAIVGEEDKVFIINNKFEKISNLYNSIEHLGNGFFQGNIVDEENETVYLIDINDNGYYKIDCDYIKDYDAYGEIIENYFVAVKDGKEFVIDTKGKTIIEPIYESISSISKVSDGIRAWGCKNGEIKLLSSNGEIPLDFEVVYEDIFSEGYANIVIETKSGYESSIVIDKDGKKVEFFNDYDKYFEKIDFTDGLMLLVSNKGELVAINDKLEIIFKISNEKYRYSYEIIEQYRDNEALISRYDNGAEAYREKVFSVDKEGNLTEKINYSSSMEKLDCNMYLDWNYSSYDITFRLYDNKLNSVSERDYIDAAYQGEYVLALTNRYKLDVYYKGEKMNIDEIACSDMHMIDDNIIEIIDNRYVSRYYTCINGKLEQIDYYSDY